MGVTHYIHSKEADEFREVTELCLEKTPEFFGTVGSLASAILRPSKPKLPRKDLVTHLVHDAMQLWYGLEPNNVHMSPELMDDPNFQEFVLRMDELERLYPGEYVAFVNGKFIDHDADKDALLDRVYKSNEEPVDVFIQKLAKPRMVHLRSPKKVST